LSAGAPPQTPLGELTALPQTASWILGGLLLREGRGGKGKGGGEERRGGEGREGEGREGRGEGTPCFPVTPPSPYILDKGLSLYIRGVLLGKKLKGHFIFLKDLNFI